MIRKAITIAREMLPSIDLAVKTAIRVSVGLALLWIGRQLPPSAAIEWIDLAGKFMVIVAAYGLIGHAEGTFANHAADKVRVIAGTIASIAAAAYFSVALLFRTEQDEPWHS